MKVESDYTLPDCGECIQHYYCSISPEICDERRRGVANSREGAASVEDQRVSGSFHGDGSQPSQDSN